MLLVVVPTESGKHKVREQKWSHRGLVWIYVLWGQWDIAGCALQLDEDLLIGQWAITTGGGARDHRKQLLSNKSSSLYRWSEGVSTLDVFLCWRTHRFHNSSFLRAVTGNENTTFKRKTCLVTQLAPAYGLRWFMSVCISSHLGIKWPFTFFSLNLSIICNGPRENFRLGFTVLQMRKKKSESWL